MRELERYVILQVVDVRWREHLENMDYLREGVHLRAMAQKDPLVEYRGEGHQMFEALGSAIHEEVVALLFHAEITTEEAAQLEQAQAAAEGNGSLRYEHEAVAGADAIAQSAGGNGQTMASAAVAGGLSAASGSVSTQQIVKSEQEQIGRNEPCWCGSGKKFKKCHGA